MKSLISSIILITMPVSGDNYPKIKKIAEEIKWYGQAGVVIKTKDKSIFIDPYIYNGNEKFDIVLITHPHDDHCNPSLVEKIIKEGTIIIGPTDVYNKMNSRLKEKFKITKPGDSIKIADITISAVSAYNIKKTQFHNKSKNWVGYIVEFDNVRIYHSGDTEKIPEMKTVNADIALLPLGQVYTMDSVEMAAEAAIDTGAKIIIPIHYGMYEGSKKDAERLKKILESNHKIEVIIKD